MYDGLASRSGYPAFITDDTDPVFEAIAALRAAGVAVSPIGDELECWQIGDFLFSDTDLWCLAASRGLVEDGRP